MITHTTDPVQEVLARLKESGRKIRQRGREWECQCAAHDDHKASLNVRAGDDGRALLKCHAGCSTESIVAALGMTMADLMAGDPPGQKTKPEIAATYNYEDEDGNLLYQALRYMPKDFRQRRPDGNGGWVWNMQDVRRVPYRLPELREHPEHPVWIAEGEKDVERLRSYGLVATCNVGGAGKWRDEYNEHLAGRVVYILPDKDQAGRDHANKIAASLQGIAAAVRIVELPGLPPKGDVSDWFNAGGTVEGLQALADGSAMEATSELPKSVARTGRILTATALLHRPAIRWLVEGIVPAGCSGVVFGLAGCCKSFAGFGLTLSIATGRAWVGMYPVQQGPTIYVAAEGVAGLSSRLRAWQKHNDATEADLQHWFCMPTGLDLCDRNSVDTFITDATTTLGGEKPALIVFDTLAKCLVGRDENSAQDVGLALDGMRRIREQLQTSTLAIHHTGKGGETERGSSAIRGDADVMLKVSQNGDIVTVKCDKAKDAAPFEDITLRRVVVPLDDDTETSCVLEYHDPVPRKIDHDADNILQQAQFQIHVDPSGVKRRTLEMALTPIHMSESAFDRAFRRLVSNGKLRKEGEHKNTRYFPTEACDFIPEGLVSECQSVSSGE